MASEIFEACQICLHLELEIWFACFYRFYTGFCAFGADQLQIYGIAIGQLSEADSEISILRILKLRQLAYQPSQVP